MIFEIVFHTKFSSSDSEICRFFMFGIFLIFCHRFMNVRLIISLSLLVKNYVAAPFFAVFADILPQHRGPSLHWLRLGSFSLFVGSSFREPNLLAKTESIFFFLLWLSMSSSLPSFSMCCTSTVEKAEPTEEGEGRWAWRDKGGRALEKGIVGCESQSSRH